VVDHATSMAGRIWRHPENRGRRGHRLAGWLSWQAWERTVGRPRTVHLHQGVRLVCRPHDQVTSMALYFGLYDSQEMRFLLAWLRAGDTFVDIGANVAPYSLLATLIDGVAIVAFEPEAVARGRAAENIALNDATDRIELVACAVSDVDGTGNLTADRWAQNTLVGDDYDGHAEAVPMVSMDSFAHRRSLRRVSLVKVDVEGHELAVLRGAAGVLAAHRPALIVECNEPEALERFAGEHGYTLVSFAPQSALLTMRRWPVPEGRNVLLVPDVAEARARVQTSSCRPLTAGAGP
jgi:FkbM family methyltransferase